MSTSNCLDPSENLGEAPRGAGILPSEWFPVPRSCLWAANTALPTRKVEASGLLSEKMVRRVCR